MITDSGLAAWVAIIGASGDTPEYVGAGTGTTTALQTDTDLETAISGRVALSSTTTETGKVIYDFTAGSTTWNGYDITELALFLASSGGNCWTHDVFSPAISKNSRFSINVKIILQLNPNVS